MFGCDKCLRVCPHNSKNLNTQAQKLFGSKITELSPENILSIEEWQFKQLFKKSPLLYAGYERLRRNISALKESSGNH